MYVVSVTNCLLRRKLLFVSVSWLYVDSLMIDFDAPVSITIDVSKPLRLTSAVIGFDG